MGQKVNPKSIRLKINELWQSRWYSKQSYRDNLISDVKIRRALEKRLKEAAISEIIINRDSNKVTIDIHTGRPGIVIGRGGAGAEELKKFLATFVADKIQINIIEVKKPDVDAAIVAQAIASQLEKRVPFKRAMKQVIDRAKTGGAKGIKVQVSGRLNGAEIARDEKISFGTVPLSTFKSDIDYKYLTALTTYGIIGVKVWIYKGERMLSDEDFVK
jgi:small subunit ribosomal protein S3